jgi:hypothetical protein
VARGGALAAGKYRSHRPASPVSRDVADGVDARVHRDEEPLGDLALDPSRAAAEGEQLDAGHVALLPIGNLQDFPPEWVVSGHSL